MYYGTHNVQDVFLERTPCIPFMEILNRHFGLIVAYLLPGFIALAGVAPLVPVVSSWLQPVNQGLGIGPPVYAIMAATATGMVVSCFRWLLIDRIHAWTGIATPALNYRALEDRMVSFNYLVESHYRYYQFYANTLIAVAWAYSVNRLLKTSSLLRFGTDLGVFILCAVLFAGSRDALAKYRHRSGQLVGQLAEKDDAGEVMTNGIDHHQGKSEAPSTPPKTQSAGKPEETPKPTPEKGKEKPAGK